MATKERGYWKVINFVIDYRGNTYLEGESRGKEVFTVLFTMVYPIFFLVSTLFVYGLFYWKNKRNNSISNQ